MLLIIIFRLLILVSMYLHASVSLGVVLLIIFFVQVENVQAQSNDEQELAAVPIFSNGNSLLSPPRKDGPVIVKAGFQLRNIGDIDDKTETFHFTGILRLSWKDQRQAFDPNIEGTKEKVYQGNYQFNESSPAWYPEVVLANMSGMFEQHGVVLRVQPDGRSILTTMISAIAEVDFNMRRYPFDTQSLSAVFEIVGFNNHEVQFQIQPVSFDQTWKNVKVSQWQIKSVDQSIGQSSVSFNKSHTTSSNFNVTIDVQRKSFFVVRLVVIPLMLIVVLSWSVFWMERSSLGDRINVSFVGILTAVAYQIVVGELLPHMSYYTLMNGFVNLSLLIMCATVVINLVVGAYDKQGKSVTGDIIDYRCRWLFPLFYISILLLFFAIAFIFF